MIKYVLGTDWWMNSDLAKSMFQDRALQFSERLRWNVDVDSNGFERDQYDCLNPIYIMIEDAVGRHAGSMRLLPTNGRTMINEHFASALSDGLVQDDEIWECTRFCISTNAEPRTAMKLFAAAGRIMQEFDITSLLAVIDKPMMRKYRLSGVMPEILGEANVAGSTIISGRWKFDSKQLKDLMAFAQLDPVECELALANSTLLQESALNYA